MFLFRVRILILILNVLFSLYCIASIFNNSNINIWSFCYYLVFTTISIIVLRKDVSWLAEIVARISLDIIPQQQMRIEIELEKRKIYKEEADKRKAGMQKEFNYITTIAGFFKIMIKIGMISLIIPLVSVLLLVTMKKINMHEYNNNIICFIFIGTILQNIFLLFPIMLKNIIKNKPNFA